MNESKQVQQSNRSNSPSRQQIHRATPSTYTTALMAARYPSDQMIRMVGIGYPSLGSGVSIANLNNLPPHLYTQPNFIYPRDGQYHPGWSPRETSEYPMQSALDSRATDPYSAAALNFRQQMSREMAHDGMSHHQIASSQGARRRPSLLPPPTVDYPYPPGIYSRLDGQDRYSQDAYSSFASFDRNKMATQQQQAAVTAQLQRGLNPLAMTQLTGHSLINQSHHGLSIGSSSSTPHHLLAHGHLMEQNDFAPKRPRLNLNQPLHIDIGNSSGSDVNKKPAYTPQVEAISPTPNEDIRNDLSPFRSTRDELSRNLERLNREISEVETQILKLKKKQLELDAASKTTPEVLEVMDTSSESKQQSIAQLVYSDNRKKAQAAHSLLDRLNHLENNTSTFQQLPSCLSIPEYNQPLDAAIYHLNLEKFKTFKPKLLVFLKKQKERERAREQYLTQTYERLTLEWKEKQDNKESNSSKKSKESKMRDFFEKQFPELKKQREDKERLSRAGGRIRSDADMEDVLDGLQEQEAEDKKMRSYAVIPPILQDTRNRKPVFINRNNLVEDPLSKHKERQHINVWTESEKEIFKERYLLQPKHFGLISSYLDKKSVCDCVQYYYLSKKVENYKQLLRRQVKKRTRALVKQQQAAAAAAAAAQQQQQQQQQNNRFVSRAITSVTGSTTSTTTTTTSTADDSSQSVTITVSSAINSSAVNSNDPSSTPATSSSIAPSSASASTTAAAETTNSSANDLSTNASDSSKCTLESTEKEKEKTQSTSDPSSASSPPVINSEDNRPNVESVSVATTTSVGLSDIQSGKLQDLRGLSSSQASLKSDNDSSATMSADEGHGDADRDRSSTSPASVVRGTATPTDSIYSPLTSTSYSVSRPEGLIAQRQQRVPSFLIHPNAPVTTNRAPPVHSVPSMQVASKEEQTPTYVRDLIYQAIEMSLKKPNTAQAPLAGSPANSTHHFPNLAMAPGLFLAESGRRTPLHSMPLPPHGIDIKQETITGPYESPAPGKSRISTPPISQELRHPGAYPPPSTLSRPEGLMMSYPHHLNAPPRAPSHSASPDNEVQDLSKKSRDSPRSQTPLHGRKDRPSTPNRSHPYSKPPPAHSNMGESSQRDVFIDVPKHKSSYSIAPPDRNPISLPPPRTPLPSQSRPLVPPPPPLITSRAGVSSPKLHSLKESRSPHGSITQGTPVMIPGSQSPMLPYGPPYEAILRPPSVPKESGSITLGTPVHHDPSKRKVDPASHKNLYDPTYEQLYRIPRPSGMPSPFRAIYPNVSEQYIPNMPKTEKAHPSASPSIHKEVADRAQLLIDFNTSKQMMARRGSSGEGKDQSVNRGRESSSPQVPPRIQGNVYTPYTGSLPSHSSSLPIFTPAISDRVYMSDRSTPTSHADARSQIARQNVIQVWPQKQASVIQTVRTASPRNDVANPQNDLSRKTQPGYPYDNLRTLSDVATAQAVLPISDKFDQQKEQSSHSLAQVVKSESPKDHRLDERQRPPSSSAMRSDQPRPEMWMDAATAAAIRPLYIPASMSDAAHSPANFPQAPLAARTNPLMPAISKDDSFERAFRMQHQRFEMARDARNACPPELQKRLEINDRYRQIPKTNKCELPAGPFVRGLPQRLTAANLVEDIIQRQINQPNENRAAAAAAAAASLSARFPDLKVNAETGLNHPTVERVTEDILQHNQRLIPHHHSSGHFASASKASDLPASAYTLGDRISSIVSRTINTNTERIAHSSPKGSDERIFQPHALSPHIRIDGKGPSSSMPRIANEESAADAASNWKLRRALQQDQEDRQSAGNANIRANATSDGARDLSRPGSRSGSGTPSAFHPHSVSPMNPMVEPISPPAAEERESGDAENRKGSARPPSHSSPIVRSVERPPSSGTKSPSASRQSLDRTPPALEISEDAVSNESPSECTK